MLRRRCSLCNGKLDSKHICKECGLDNTKCDQYYKINQSSCDHKPLTHVHEEEKSKKKNQKVKKEKRKKGKLSIILSIIIMLAGIIPSLITIFKELEIVPETCEVSDNPYESVDQLLPTEGEYAEYTFTSGEYIVGIHLPEGNYEAAVEDEYDVVQVKDNENDIYLYEYQAKASENYLHDLRLYNGAIVTINTKTEVVLQSPNAQYQNMGSLLENPLKDSCVLEIGTDLVAGNDFKAGIYNLYATADYAYFYMMYEDEYGEQWEYYRGLEIGTKSECGMLYQNVVIPEGAFIWCEGGNIEVIPAEGVGDMDYTKYYW